MARARASAWLIGRCRRMASTICCPIVWTGLRLAIGSWKIIADLATADGAYPPALGVERGEIDGGRRHSPRAAVQKDLAADDAAWLWARY